jgi:hypothetical protein
MLLFRNCSMREYDFQRILVKNCARARTIDTPRTLTVSSPECDIHGAETTIASVPEERGDGLIAYEFEPETV